MRGLLALELSPDPCSLALLREDEQVFTRNFAGERGRALLHEVDALFTDASMTRDHLTGIVVGIGPGSYTGLRIACTAARTLAFALEIPCAGLSSFEAAIDPDHVEETHVVLDAYRGEVYHGAGRAQQDHVTMTQAPRVCTLEELAPQLAGKKVVCDARLHESLADLAPAAYAPHAQRLLQLARARGVTFDGKGFGALDPSEPLYLRAAAFRPGS